MRDLASSTLRSLTSHSLTTRTRIHACMHARARARAHTHTHTHTHTVSHSPMMQLLDEWKLNNTGIAPAHIFDTEHGGGGHGGGGEAVGGQSVSSDNSSSNLSGQLSNRSSAAVGNATAANASARRQLAHAHRRAGGGASASAEDAMHAGTSLLAQAVANTAAAPPFQDTRRAVGGGLRRALGRRVRLSIYIYIYIYIYVYI